MFTATFIGWVNKRFVTSPAARLDSSFDPTTRPWFIEAANAKKPILTNPYMDVDNEHMIATIASPIMNDQDELVAISGADINMQEIVNLVRQTQPTPNSYALLVDGQGRIVAHCHSPRRCFSQT